MSDTFPDHRGGRAFPTPNGLHHGMTLRDYFAAQSLPTAVKLVEGLTIKHLAIAAYGIADAMIAEREK